MAAPASALRTRFRAGFAALLLAGIVVCVTVLLYMPVRVGEGDLLLVQSRHRQRHPGRVRHPTQHPYEQGQGLSMRSHEHSAPMLSNAITWSYAAPEHWAELDTSFDLCGSGQEQSPVELGSGAELLALPSLRWHVSSQQETRPVEFFTGHTLQVQGVGHPTLSFNATTYSLSQIHTHTPSEHTIDGEQFALEMHFLHTTRTNKTTKHAVLAVMFKEGAASPAPIRRVLESLPPADGARKPVEDFDFSELAVAVLQDMTSEEEETVRAEEGWQWRPNKKNFFTYIGSLTTPPCSEGVRWLVLKNALEVAPQDLKALQELEGANNRPVQPLNGRTVVDAGGSIQF